MSDGKAIIKIAQVAEMLGMSVRAVRTLIDNETIKTIPTKPGATRLFSRSYIERLVDGKETVVKICSHCGKDL